MIDWTSSESHWQLPPHLSALDRRMVNEAKAHARWIRGHVWIASSGTTRVEGQRWVGVSKAAMLTSAEAVNRHLQVAKEDVWLNVLPLHHVGGLSIFTRAHLGGNVVHGFFSKKWNATDFSNGVEKNRATLTSLVPTQVFDLVQAGLRAPSSLRAIVVGGGVLSSELYERARALGWPVLPSYGLTECCSQVATAELASLETGLPKLKILSHVTLETREERLRIRSESLADFVLTVHPRSGLTLEDPRRHGWLLTEDRAELQDGFVRVLGRVGDRVKVLGELVSLARVEDELQRFVADPVCVLAVPHPRKGNALIAVVENPASLLRLEKDLDGFHGAANPLWRLEQCYTVDRFPRSELGKVRSAQLKAALGFEIG